MKRKLILVSVLILSCLSAIITITSAQQTTSRRIPQRRENFDLRASHKRSLEKPPEGESRTRRERPGVMTRWSSLTGTPSRIWSFNGTISQPVQEDAESGARRFIKDNSDLFQLADNEVDSLRIARRYRTEHNGLTHITLRQQVGGIEVFQAEYAIHIDREGAVIAASGELIPDVAGAVNTSRPRLTAADAMRAAAREVGAELSSVPTLRAQPAGAEQRQEFDRSAGFGDHVKARLIYFPVSAKQVQLAWEFILAMRETPDFYLVLIDAERGSMLFLHNLTCYDENPLRPHGLVFTKESPRPNLPVTVNNPPTIEREDLPFRATPYNGRTIFDVSDHHYDWWAGVNADNLISNNTSTYVDRDTQPNQPDQPRLMAPDGNFSFPLNLSLAPTTEDYQKAAQVNLFYWVNRYHDILYSFGFNEGAGNFQSNNFGLGGNGNDAINAEAQDGSGANNANFSTLPDGAPGRVQMYLWTTANPQLDGDFDQGVIIHELTHGLSNRLIGNATGLVSIQDRGMGEGWSDWFGLALLAQEGDDPGGSYPVGQYVTNNYTRSIRRFPYSTDPAIFPLTFKDISSRVQVHAIGEIWCNTLWEMRALMIQKHGFREGQRQSIQLVVDGMKMTPIAPSFLDARNAILLADRVNNGSANQCLLWQAFSKRGMGFRASTDDVNDVTPAESFDNAPYCSDTGILALDKKNYVTGEMLRISVGDRNASISVAVQLTSSVTGDRETLTLDPETGIPSSFLGAMRLVEGRANRGDGILQGSTERVDEINVLYNDPNSSDGGPAQINFKAFVSREKALFDDSVERGNQGWIPTGSWAITNSAAASGRSCWTDSPRGNYTNSSNSQITSPLMDFTGLGDVTLTFAHNFDLENRFDYGIVEYSNDDGSTWVRAAAYTGRQANFLPTRVVLSGLDGQARARVRFRLFTDISLVADGWYIDDIRLTARTNNAALIPNTAVTAITAVSPAFGPPSGGTRVTISGLSFTENETTSVTFDGIPAASVNVFGTTTITALSPAHAPGPVTVRVINRNGAAALAGGFTYFNPGSGAGTPTLTTLFPNSGSVRGGTAVTVLGSNFTPETLITFGGQRGEVTFINAGVLRVRTPAAASTGAVEVAAGNGAAQATLPGGFNYISTSPPAVAVLSPGGGETYFDRSVININWRSSDNNAVTRHRVALIFRDASGLQFLTFLADDLPGDAQSFAWMIPAGVVPTLQARIRVTAIDDEGAETEALSSSDFTLARRWESSALLPISLQRPQVAGDGQYLYAIGGRTSTTNNTTLTTVSRLDPSAATPTWASLGLATMPTGLNGGEAAFLRGRIYIPGGINAGGQLSNLHFSYDVTANQWTQQAEPPSASFLYALAVDEANGLYFRTGGTATAAGATGITTARSYNPMTNAWVDLPPMSTARYGHEAAFIDGKLYVVGGWGTSSGLTTGEVYDFGTRQWAPIAPLNRPRFFAVSFVARDPGGNPLWFVVGGQETSTLETLATEVYDVRNNRWITPDESFVQPTLRSLSGGASVGNFFYAIGGQTVRLIPGGTASTLSRATERMRLDQVTPIPLDQAPVIVVPASQVAVANNELRFAVTANDLNSEAPITISADGLPSGANFSVINTTNNSARGTFNWTPSSADTGRTFNVAFTVSDRQLSDTKVVTIRVVTAGPLSAVNAADFRMDPLAPDSIAAAFGTDLAVRTEAAGELPLPFELAGTTLTVDGMPAPLFFVSPTQINFAVPSSVDLGSATIIVSNPAGSYALGNVQVAPAAPAIFTLTANGLGDAAAVATADGVTFQTQPFDIQVNGRPNILLLFGTGIRRADAANPNDDNGVAESVSVTIDGRPASVLYAGAQGVFSGLDQINVELPAGLAGGGLRRVEVVMMVNGVTANRVTIQIR